MVSRASSQLMRSHWPLPLGPDAAHRVGEPVGMVGQLRRGDALAAEGAVADGAVGVAGDLLHPAVLDVDEHAAAAVAHAAVALHHPVVAVDLHLARCVGVAEVSHLVPWYRGHEVLSGRAGALRCQIPVTVTP